MFILSDTTHRAKKFYQCDACAAWNQDGIRERDVSAEDWLIVQACKADAWKIKPGHKYRRVIYKDGGLVTYRGRLDMDALCLRHGLFDEH